MAEEAPPFHFFDPKQPFSVTRRRLPHWTQAGTLAFLTWRMWDSMPREVLESWLADRDGWLRRHGIDPRTQAWRTLVRQLPRRDLEAFLRSFSDRWQDALDACHGSCVLRRPELSAIVAEALAHFDGVRYELTDFVVMPNHVHVVVALADEAAMLAQCRSWKQFTATRINRHLGRRGRFWQQDGFDHLVRSDEQWRYLREYIAGNPARARLEAGEFVHYAKAPDGPASDEEAQCSPHAPREG